MGSNRLLLARRRVTLAARLLARRAIAARYLRGNGLEIGALHLPLPLHARAHATYVDRVSTRELREQLPELHGREIVDVEIIDDGERLASVADASQDFVIANHMIEHCEDPIGTIGHHLRVLRPGGRVFMAVPEKRRTFDRDRPVTSFEHLVADHRQGPERSRRDHYAEWARFIDDMPADRIDERVRYLEDHSQCIHFHVWTRSAFRELLDACASDLGLPLEVNMVWPNFSEFVAVFTRSDAPLSDADGSPGAQRH